MNAKMNITLRTKAISLRQCWGAEVGLVIYLPISYVTS